MTGHSHIVYDLSRHIICAAVMLNGQWKCLQFSGDLKTVTSSQRYYLTQLNQPINIHSYGLSANQHFGVESARNHTLREQVTTVDSV